MSKLLLMGLIIFLSCANKKITSSDKVDKKILELIETTSQVSSGGAAGSNSTKKYTFLLKKLVKDSIIIDSVWIDQYVLKLQYQMPFRRTYGVDTLALSARVNNIRQETKTEWPMATDKKGLLRFYLNGKPAYVEIDSIRSLQPVMYPGIKPKGDQ